MLLTVVYLLDTFELWTSSCSKNHSHEIANKREPFSQSTIQFDRIFFGGGFRHKSFTEEFVSLIIWVNVIDSCDMSIWSISGRKFLFQNILIILQMTIKQLHEHDFFSGPPRKIDVHYFPNFS